MRKNSRVMSPARTAEWTEETNAQIAGMTEMGFDSDRLYSINSRNWEDGENEDLWRNGDIAKFDETEADWTAILANIALFAASMGAKAFSDMGFFATIVMRAS